MASIFDKLDEIPSRKVAKNISSEKTTSSIFNRLDEIPSRSREEKLDIPEQPSRLRSLLSAAPKGALKAIQSTIESPLLPRGPIPPKLGKKLTEKLLPTRDEPLERLLERTGKVGTYAFGGPGSLISKSIATGAGALLGQGLEEIGAPKIFQDILESVPLLGRNLKKEIPIGKGQEKSLNFLRSKGFSEREITPLIQSPEKLARFSKFASRGQKTDKIMRDIYNKFDELFSGIREKGQNTQPLSGKNIDEFLGSFQTQFDKIRPMHKRLIQNSVDDLLKSEMKFNDFVNFYQDINAITKGTEGGKAVLNILKDPINKAMFNIEPTLAEEFQLTNQFYGKRADVSSHLRPDQYQGLIDMGEIYATATGIADKNIGLLTKVLGLVGARKLARELLINPRLQNLGKRMLQAIKENKISILPKLMEQFKKESPEIDYP